MSHDGFRMPMGFPVEGFSSGLRYRPSEGDVFVATYPKCGTTWMQYIVYLLVSGGRSLAGDERLDAVFPHLEEVGAEAVSRLPEPRLIKTHLPFSIVPYRREARYIHVARNPFDCAVSFFHHTRGFVRHYDFAHGTFDDFFECFITGEVDFGDYFEHLTSWYARIGDENLFFVTYERMVDEPRAVIAEVGEFLGGAARVAARDEARIAEIAEASSFSRMRRAQQRWSSARPAGMPEFVRKGTVGDWRSCFSAEQARRLADAFERRLGASPAAALWREIVDEALQR